MDIQRNDFEESPNLIGIGDFIEPKEEEEQPQDSLGFDPAMTEAFNGLTFVGQLTKVVQVFGHEILIRTLKSGEELAVAQLVKQYENSLAHGKAGMMAYVAACVETVDGLPLPRSLSSSTTAILQERFNFVQNNWDTVVVEAIYFQYRDLDAVKRQVAEEVNLKLSNNLRT